MTADTDTLLLSAGAAALLAITFIFGGGFHPLRAMMHDRRSMISFGAGMSSAYVFVHVLPELSEARRTLTEASTLRALAMMCHFVSVDQC